MKPELYELGQCTVQSKMGNTVLAYDPERTICDILRSRNRIDNQVFKEALKSYFKRRDQDWRKLAHYTEAFRITKLLHQYLEILT